MKALRELKIRFEPTVLRPRVFWRRCVRSAAPGAGEPASPSLHIELKKSSIFITSVDERRPNEESPANGTWEEVFDTRAAWTGGARVAVDFGDEYPDAVRTLIGIGLAPGAEEPKKPEPKAESEAGTLTRFFDIEVRAAGVANDPAVEQPRPSTPMSMQKTQVIRGPALAAIESMVQGYARRVKRSLRGARITAPRALLLALLVLCLVVLLASRMRIFGRNEGSAAAATRPAPAATTKTSSALAKPDQEPNPASPSRAALSEIAPPTSRGEKTLERRAADAIATGAFSDALPLYDELARQHPDLRVYREALRILRGQKPAGRTADAR